MKISVLIAASRSGAHIAEALASVRAQSHTSWEAIVAEPRSYTGQFLKELLERRPGRKREAAE